MMSVLLMSSFPATMAVASFPSEVVYLMVNPPSVFSWMEVIIPPFCAADRRPICPSSCVNDAVSSAICFWASSTCFQSDESSYSEQDTTSIAAARA